MKRMIDSEMVDKEHKIEFSRLNAKLNFLKESENNGIKDAKELLLDAHASLFVIFSACNIRQNTQSGFV